MAKLCPTGTIGVGLYLYYFLRMHSRCCIGITVTQTVRTVLPGTKRLDTASLFAGRVFARRSARTNDFRE